MWPAATQHPEQPYLHSLVTCLAAPSVWLSGRNGQTASGPTVGTAAEGLYVGERRALSLLRVTVDGTEPEPLSVDVLDASSVRFTAALPGLGHAGREPAVLLRRTRTAFADGGSEVLECRNDAAVEVRTRITVEVASDLVTVSEIKAGTTGGPLISPHVDAADAADGLVWTRPDGFAVTLITQPPPEADPGQDPSGTAEPPPLSTAGSAELTWPVVLPPNGGTFRLTLTLRCDRQSATQEDAQEEQPSYRQLAPVNRPRFGLQVTATDRRLDQLVARSAQDVACLLLADPDDPRDLYAAAGAPWYLTLFGRDSLWAARFALPLDPAIALGTVRTLARRQGKATDPGTEEAPGKIVHEVRPAGESVFLPPRYYGTVDATPLFVSTVADAWRWGARESAIAELLPAVDRALAWMAADGDPDSDGFLEYAGPAVAAAGLIGGLTNQGWKDSEPAVRFADGRLAKPPIALAEVQAYAYAAALDGAALLAAFGRPDAERWLDWAASLADRFRAAFWVADDDGAFPAMALDGAKHPCDAVASNMGHLLGTGLLDKAETELVAKRLAGPGLASGWGVRTLSDRSAGYAPLSYHLGSVWPHDTMIAIAGLVTAERPVEAGQLATGLVAAAEGFGWRLPELFSGSPAGSDRRPLPYPAACRPQAWSAGVGPALVTALLGLRPDLPNGVLRIDPVRPAPFGALTVRGLRLGTGSVDVTVDTEAKVTVSGLPAGLRVLTGAEAARANP